MHNTSSLVIQALFGFVFLMGLTACFSDNRKAINWRLILTAFIVQNILFLLIRYVPVVHAGLGAFSAGLVNMLGFAQDGAKFIFGDFANSKKFGFVFLLVVVPTIVFFGSVVSILYFFGIIQRVIAVLAFCLRKTVKLSGVESLIVIADIFLGQTEAPLLIGPYVKVMTKSELTCALVAGMANLSGSTLGMYLSFLSGGDQHQELVFATYLVTATFMNAMSAVVFAKILCPETEFDHVSSEKIEVHSHLSSSFFDSVVQGAMTGLKVAAAMITVLMAVISLVHLFDACLMSIGGWVHINHYISQSTNGSFSGLSLEYLLGQIFRVFAFFMGVDWAESLQVGSLLGQKVALNEFVAYMSLGEMKDHGLLSENAVFISTFALASFSNFSSIGISMGIFSILAPSRQKDLGRIIWKAFFGAVLAGVLTATIAGLWHNVLG